MIVVIWIIGVGAILVVGVIIIDYFLKSKGISYQVEKGEDLSKIVKDKIAELGLLNKDERIIYFYSDGTTSLEQGMYFFTEDRIVSYISDSEDDEPVFSIGYDYVSDIQLEKSNSWTKDSYLKVYSGDKYFEIPLSNDDGGDDDFYKSLRDTWLRDVYIKDGIVIDYVKVAKQFINEKAEIINSSNYNDESGLFQIELVSGEILKLSYNPPNSILDIYYKVDISHINGSHTEYWQKKFIWLTKEFIEDENLPILSKVIYENKDYETQNDEVAIQWHIANPELQNGYLMIVLKLREEKKLFASIRVYAKFKSENSS